MPATQELSYRFATMGCKVNQAESQFMETDFIRRGWSQVTDNPTVYLVNTCAVTSVSEAKSRRLIRRIIRENPLSRLVVTGCYASRNPAEISRHTRTGFDMIIPQEDKDKIPSLLNPLFNSSKVQGFRRLNNSLEPLSIGTFKHPSRTRAFLKIQDGCANFCSYCIVPLLRGKPVSKSVTKATAEADKLVKDGFKEIVLVGINLGTYSELTTLLRRLVRIKGLERIRLSSIEVNDVTDDLLLLMASQGNKICPHLHIPLQSGSDRVLRLMNRHYTAGEYLEKIGLIRSRLMGPGISTDIIIGFPGETESDFADTMRVAKGAGFSKIHIFPYSRRPGTKAENLDGRVDCPTVKGRFRRLDILQKELALSYKRQIIGKKVTILTEGKGESGFTPEYLKVRIKSRNSRRANTLVDVLIRNAAPEYLEGDIYESN